MILGVCEVNSRQHCTGVWVDLPAVWAEIGAFTDIVKLTEEQIQRATYPLSAGAVNVYEITLADYVPDTFPWPCDDITSFVLYEYIDEFPGFCPYNSD